MGSILLKKLSVLVSLITLTGILIHWEEFSSGMARNKDIELGQALSSIKGWTSWDSDPLDPNVARALELDSYVNRNYSNGQDTISVYVGYYFRQEKVGLAHDPLVCFHGQGWVISPVTRGKLHLNPLIEEPISYNTMTVEQGGKKIMIMYWFQSYDHTSTSTMSQKMMSLWAKIVHHREDNAFVRLSILMGEKSTGECQEKIVSFIESFYPVLLDYIRR